MVVSLHIKGIILMISNDEQQNLIRSAKKGFNLWVSLEDIIHAPSDVAWAPLFCRVNPSANRYMMYKFGNTN